MNSKRPPLQELLERREEEVINGAEVLAAFVQAELEEDQLPLLHFPGPLDNQGGFLQGDKGQSLSPGRAAWSLSTLASDTQRPLGVQAAALTGKPTAPRPAASKLPAGQTRLVRRRRPACRPVLRPGAFLSTGPKPEPSAAHPLSTLLIDWLNYRSSLFTKDDHFHLLRVQIFSSSLLLLTLFPTSFVIWKL